MVAASRPATSVPRSAAISEALARRKSPARIAFRLPQRSVDALDAPTGLGFVDDVVVAERPHLDQLHRHPTEDHVVRDGGLDGRIVAGQGSGSGDGEQRTGPLPAGGDEVTSHLRHQLVLGLHSRSEGRFHTRSVPGHPRELEKRALGGHPCTLGEGPSCPENRHPSLTSGGWIADGRARAGADGSRCDVGGRGYTRPTDPPEGAGGSLVRTVHRPSPTGRRTGPRGSSAPQPQLHRHRAHPARADPRGRRRGRQGPRIPRHLAGGRAQPGRGDHRPRAARRRPATSPSRRGPRRSSSCRCGRPCSSATTTSAPSTSCSG